jgi:hypothetical protein
MNKIIKKLHDLLIGCDPEVGETWYFVIRPENPFMEAELFKSEILDVKKGWVKYLDPDKIICARTIRSFRSIYNKLTK